MAEITSLSEAVAGLIQDGQTVALEGFTHLIPSAAGHEIVRQRRTGLTLVRMTPDLIYDQLIGMGCAKKLIFSWGGNPGVGSLHRFRDAVEKGWPVPLSIEEHSHAGLANAYVAGASNLPLPCCAAMPAPICRSTTGRSVRSAARSRMRSWRRCRRSGQMWR